MGCEEFRTDVCQNFITSNGGGKAQEELEFRRRCPYDAFGDYSDVLKEIRQKEKENKTDTVSVVNRSK